MNDGHIPIPDVDAFDHINEVFYERGWTDGLPIVPPTEERVRAMLAGMPWRKAEELISVVPPRMGHATLQHCSGKPALSKLLIIFLTDFLFTKGAVLQ